MNNNSKICNLTIIAIAILGLTLTSFSTSNAPIYEGPDIQVIGESFYQDLEFEYQRYSYQLDALDNGVPPIILANLPEDLANISSTNERKRLFFKALLPMILLANDEIRVERNKLLKIQKELKTTGRLTKTQKRALTRIASHYKVDYNPGQEEIILQKLFKRVDIIPADLALAQAANESGWGTSRFTQVANNIFGEWTFKKGAGIVPEDRPAGATYEVEKFATVYDSVRSYLHNLNTHKAYTKLRQIRFEIRQSGDSLDGLKLAEGLTLYSIRGEDYVRELQAMIRKNRLSRFSDVKLRTSS